MLKFLARRICVVGSVCMTLTACFDSSSSHVTSSVVGTIDRSADTGLAPSSSNTAPTITGTPGTVATAGATYSFQPSSQDADGDSLQFSITGKPAWATFSVSTGQLSGVPAASEAGTYDNIVISVTDGKTTASQPAFSIAVNSTAATKGTAVLSWQASTPSSAAPTPTDVAGYRVYHGFSASALTEVREISAPDISSYVFDALVSGTHYFAVSTYTFGGIESALSAIVSKTIP
jgi:hypothetical protein